MEFQVLKKSRLKRNILIGVGAVLIISVVILNFTRAKYRVTQSIPLVNGTINYSLPDLNIIGLYIDGVEADELDSAKTYTLNTEQSTCTYKDGSIINNLTLNYDSDTGGLSISPYTTKGTKCTLYFEEYVPSAVDVIEDAYANNPNMLVYDEHNNLRYIGANPNNYVYFNCDDYDNPSSSTCELWRIIGIFNEDTHGINGQKLIKLIRNESLGRIDWGSGGTDDWTTASLNSSLNEYYLLGDSLGTGKGITSSTRNMIENITWKIGGNERSADTTINFYSKERGTTVYGIQPTEWKGKIALMYPSDYGYATSGGETVDRMSCLSVVLSDWADSSYSDCKNNDWLYNDDIYEWLLTPYAGRSDYVFAIFRAGSVEPTSSEFYAGEARPSLYLTTSVVVTGGVGTSTDPYQLV